MPMLEREVSVGFGHHVDLVPIVARASRRSLKRSARLARPAYQFWDGGSGASSGYFWTPANSHWAAGIAIDVSAADLDDVWLRGGAGTGTETMYARSFDGIDWSAWHAFVLTTII
ncbi:hypothetical protein [Bradyrhizobium sp. JYMT SZCCT0180]|uniref:hypothetical protein n=1 Tax=Bradyrhizobium sp. JYMT SZCCT0180 TaxID=2807666 RepID=UPI002011E45D|nr:hypothetical protein [Bradyrhizobium sp. JYMT SZCCT0180]